MSREDLLRVLEESGPGMDVLQAIRLLEAVHPERRPVGGNWDPADEVARFTVRPAMAFPAGDVHDVDIREEEPSRLMVNLFGFVGPDGVMPHVYTRLVADQLRDRNPALRDFLDIFQHRFLSLLVRALRKTELAAAREAGGPEADRLFRHLLDLVGLPPGTESVGGMAGHDIAPFSALPGPQRRSAFALELLVEGRFGVPAEVESFVGGWIRLSEDDLCELGSDDDATRLGAGAVVGDEIWDPHARVRVRLGPLDRETFDAFLPGGAHHEKLRDLCRFFVHDQFVVEACLVLQRDEVPDCLVSDDRDGPTLGWSTWLRTQSMDRDPDETLLTL
ncbi:MAG: type VI secretion system baseplate subunit TssG [Gemmatimonadetes bacterium]|nr:type VI secretion system baseplate subunit TssG [Gemmatimonadota bacterium]